MRVQRAASQIKTLVRDLTTAELGAFQATPIDLAAAPGAGLVYAPTYAVVQYNPGTAPFYGDITDARVEVCATPGDKQTLLLQDSPGLVTSALAESLITSVQLNDLLVTAMAITADPGIESNAPMRLTMIGGSIEIGGAIVTASAADGALWLPGDTADLLGDYAINATASVATVLNGYPITAVDQGAKTFTVTGDASAAIPALAIMTVFRSTGNDGLYTVSASVFGAGSTVITVVEVIPSAVGDGGAGNNATTAGTLLTITITAGGSGYIDTEVLAVVADPADGQTDGTGAVTSITETSDGTARIIVTYSLVSLLT